jgi:hypothetical protein
MHRTFCDLFCRELGHAPAVFNNTCEAAAGLVRHSQSCVAHSPLHLSEPHEQRGFVTTARLFGLGARRILSKLMKLSLPSTNWAVEDHLWLFA